MGKGAKITIIAVAVILIAAIAALGTYAVNIDAIQINTSINGVDVSGLTKEEAEQKLLNSIEPVVNNSDLLLKFGEKNWNINYKALKFQYNYKEAVEKAYAPGHTGNYFRRLLDIAKSKYTKNEITLNYSYDENFLPNELQKIAGEIDQEAVDAKIALNGGAFVITDEKTGYRLKQEEAKDLISKEIQNVSDVTIELPVEILQPAIKRADLENIKDKLGEYSTKFNAADTDRTYNIKLATKSASDVLVRPGEIYSLNKTVGPRLEKHGYKIAKVIINNELVPGIGGGVCQVSSTLYNAALLSNLKIVERRNHSLPSSYVPLGRDATISGDYIDLKFENTTAYPIFIHGEVNGSWVKFSIYGRNDNPGRTVKIRTVMVKKTEPTITIIEDPTLPEGTEVEEKKAYTGYVVKTYRDIYENGKLVLTEPPSNSTYRVTNGVKRVGTKKVEEPPATPELPVGQ